MNDGKKNTELPDAPLAPSAGRTTSMEDALARFRDMVKGRNAGAPADSRETHHQATAEVLSEAYALVGDTFDPYYTPQVHALLDQLKELGAVVVDRRDVERWRVERAEAEVAAARHRKK